MRRRFYLIGILSHPQAADCLLELLEQLKAKEFKTLLSYVIDLANTLKVRMNHVNLTL